MRPSGGRLAQRAIVASCVMVSATTLALQGCDIVTHTVPVRRLLIVAALHLVNITKPLEAPAVRMTVPDARSNTAAENLQCMIGAFQKHISGESKLVQLWKKSLSIASQDAA